MGYLHYGDHGTAVEIGDRALAHLQVVIIPKLRRGESFAFSWIEPTSTGSGRNTIWVHPMVTLRFKFAGSRPPSINPAWVAELAHLVNSDGGLRCTSEPAGLDPGERLHQPLVEVPRTRTPRSNY